MPAQFDDFKILDAKLDEYVSVLRKAGEDYWVGSLTSRESRELLISLDFLEPGKTFKATLYEDAAETHFETNKEVCQIREMSVTSETVINVKMAPGGGHSVWIRE